MEGALGDSVRIFDGRDLEAEPRVRVWVTAPRAARRNGSSGLVLPVPFGAFGNPGLLARLRREEGRRRYPISVESVVGPTTRIQRYEITIPEGWMAELPVSLRAESRYGVYESSYVQEGRVVRLERILSGREGTAPKEALGELIEWLDALADDDVGFLILKPLAPGS